MSQQPDAEPTIPAEPTPASLRSLTGLFLKLGTIAFGGPAAHIAMMEDEVVRRRQWLSRERFLDLLGTASLIPGPSSTELAIFIGYIKAGWRGLVLAGACFILPAGLIVSGFAWAYVHYGALPQVSGILYGVKPVVIAIIAQAVWGMGRTAVKTWLLGVLGLAALIASTIGVAPIIVLFGTAVLSMLAKIAKLQRRSQLRQAALLLPTPIALSTPITAAATVGLWPVFLFFLKIGSIVFGSGYVLLAFLRGDLVDRWGWLTNSQLLDAVAVGQVTPGPVFTTATFIGYLLAGPRGAVVATLGVFLPSFVLVAISGPLIPRIRKSAIAGAFLDGAVVAALALMIVVSAQLEKAALVDPLTIGVAFASFIAVVAFRVNSAWLVLAGAAIGFIAFAIGKV
ncbi:MAG TPA: chromate efflux transporter [Blastocatellia bacterium]|nr:chromate efflux transporter [Blastocatellia bacterium]